MENKKDKGCLGRVTGFLKKCCDRSSYSDGGVYVFNMSVLVAGTVLFCFGCVLFFM